MRVAWFTPWWSHSAIASFSEYVTERLGKTYEIDLWVPEVDGRRSSTLDVIEFDPSKLDKRIAGYDINVYCLGNNFAFHDAIMRVQAAIPGVVVLHDSVMHHVYLDQARLHSGQLDSYAARLTRWYGRSVADEALAFLEDPSMAYPPDDFCARYPLLEETALDALGVVVHSKEQAERLLPFSFGPFERLSLPSYEAEYSVGLPPAPRTDEPVRLLSVGWVGEPKQIHLALDALIMRPDLRSRITYKIAGPVDRASPYGQSLLERVETHRLESCVEFLDYVTDGELDEWLAWADAFVNLRWPSTEGGSASLLQQLITGKPVVVSVSGIFGEIPDHAVLRVSEPNASAVAVAFERLLDPVARMEIGTAGRTVARQFTVGAYAEGIAPVLEDAPRWRLPLRIVDHIGDELRALGAEDGLDVLLTVGAEMSQLFGPSLSQGRSMRREPPTQGERD